VNRRRRLHLTVIAVDQILNDCWCESHFPCAPVTEVNKTSGGGRNVCSAADGCGGWRIVAE
jgi:hypothetical protein